MSRIVEINYCDPVCPYYDTFEDDRCLMASRSIPKEKPKGFPDFCPLPNPNDEIPQRDHHLFANLLFVARDWIYEKATNRKLAEAVMKLDHFVYPMGLDPLMKKKEYPK